MHDEKPHFDEVVPGEPLKESAKKAEAEKVTEVRTMTTPKPPGPPLPPSVKPNSDAYWAMEHVREALKTRVARAKESLKKAVRKIEASPSYWTAKNLPETFTRAAMVYLPSKKDLSEQFRREFRAFFMSWIHVRTKQPESFR